MARTPRFRARPIHAALYDRLCRSSERGELGRLRAELLAPLTGDVLEIGAGTGGNFRHYRAGVRLIATEPDPHMLRRAVIRANDAAARVSVMRATAEALPLTDGSCDAVVSTLVLCTVTDPQRALAEVVRVLRPGGVFAFGEHVRSAGWPGLVQDVIRPVWSWCAGGCTVNRRTEQMILSSGLVTAQIEPGRLGSLPSIWGFAVKPRR